jgi:hypothetical protein
MPSITYIWTTFVKPTISKSIIFKVKSIFEPNVLKLVIKTIFISSNHFYLLIINVKILFNYFLNGAHLVKKWNVWKKTRTFDSQGLSVLNMQKYFWFVSSFEHAKFAINEKYSKKNYDNPNYYVSLVIFQTYKNVVLKSVHSHGWFLWLWFYSKVYLACP